MSEVLHTEETVTTLFLIRHGHTAHTESGKLYSDPASTLTDAGRQEAKAIADWLPSQNPQMLLASPSVRARATADAIAQSSGLTVEVAEQMREWQVGSWEGRSYLEIKKEAPAVYQAWSKDPIRNAPPGGESIEQLCARALTGVKELHRRYQGKRLVLVSHAELIRAILVDALGMPVDNFWRLNIPTASVSQLDWSDHFATLQYMAWRPR